MKPCSIHYQEDGRLHSRDNAFFAWQKGAQWSKSGQSFALLLQNPRTEVLVQGESTKITTLKRFNIFCVIAGLDHSINISFNIGITNGITNGTNIRHLTCPKFGEYACTTSGKA